MLRATLRGLGLTCALAAGLIAPVGAPGAVTPVDRIGTVGTGAGQLDAPTGVAFDDAGNLYVSEQGNHRISVFTPSGTFLRAFGDGVDPDAGDGFEFCTTATGCKEGELTGGPGALSNPAGIAFDSAGNLYVTEYSDHRVSVFTTTPTFVRAFGDNVDSGGGTGFEVCTTNCQPGSESDLPGGLDAPYAVAIDGSDNVHVAEYDNHRLSVFSSTPTFLRALGKNVDSVSGGGGLEVCTTTCQVGVGDATEGSLFGPDGLAFDADGALHVVEHSNHRVSAINPTDGSFLALYGLNVDPAGGSGFETCFENCQAGDGNAAHAGSLGNPVGITFDENRAFVADQDGNHVVALAAGPAYSYTVGADVIPGGAPFEFEVCTATTGCQTGDGGTGVGAVGAPQFMALDSDGRLHVAELGSGQVEIFAESDEADLGKVTRQRRKGTAKLRVEVAGPGKVKLIKTGKVRSDSESLVGTGGTVRLDVRARGSARRKLRTDGSARVSARVRFTPLAGDEGPASKKAIRLKKR